jgi:hypothetical protein
MSMGNSIATYGCDEVSACGARRPNAVDRLAQTLIALSFVLGSEIAYGQDTAQVAATPDATDETATPVEHPLKGAIRFAQTALDAMEDVRDYECVMKKRERINGELQTQVMFMRFREEPFSVYFKFGDPNPGREVLYVEGENDGRMLAHEGEGAPVRALFGTVSLPVDGPEALKNSRHVITDSGFRNSLTMLIGQWEKESAYAEINVQYYPDARLGDIACRVVEVSHPQPRRQFPFHISRLYLDAETNLPVRVENYGWPEQTGGDPVLIEEYTYVKLRTNVGLEDRHFDREFEEYNF